MGRALASRVTSIAGSLVIILGLGLVFASPASAAPVTDIAELRAAITARNASDSAGDDPIELAAGTTYTIGGDECDGTPAEEDDNASGDLDIRRSAPLEIFTAAGQAPAVLEVACADPDLERAIEVLPPFGSRTTGALTLRTVVIRNGHASDSVLPGNFGGAVLALSNLVLDNVAVENNAAGNGSDGESGIGGNGNAGGFGGGVAAFGAVTITGSTFTGNRAGDGGRGGDPSTEPCTGEAGGAGGQGGQGGAVWALSGIDISDSTFSTNEAGDGGDGGEGGCSNSDFPDGGDGGAGGQAGSGGAVQCGALVVEGAVASPCEGDTIVRASTLTANRTGSGGDGGAGGDGLDGGSGAGGSGGDGGGATESGTGLGGAILFVGGEDDAGAPTTLLVENSTIDGNASGDGGDGGAGGVGGDSPITAQLPGGHGGDGGDGGDGGVAGAIAAGFAEGDFLTSIAALVHDTITENGSGGAAGTPAAGSVGGSGAPDGTPGSAGDPGTAGGGGLAFFDPWESEATVLGATEHSGTSPDCLFPSNTSSYSTDTDGSCGFDAGSDLGQQAFSAFALGALADNGGPTATRLPAEGSVLIDEVTSELTVDQRGVSRPQGPASDIGAVEVELIAADLGVSVDAPTSAAKKSIITYTIEVTNEGPVTAENVVLSFSTSPGAAFNSATAPPGWTCTTPKKGKSGLVTCTIGALADGAAEQLVVTYKATAKPGQVVFAEASVTSDTEDPTATNNSAIVKTTITS